MAAKPTNQLALAKDEFRRYLRRSVEVARTLRDELRVQAHLGTEQAKWRLETVEKRLAHFDSLAHDLNHAAARFIDGLIEIVRDASVGRSVKRRAKRRARRPGAKP
jgi:hypothetical protein